MTHYLDIDESRFPLVVFTQTGVMDDKEFDRFLGATAAHLDRRTPFAYAYEFNFSHRPPNGRVARQAEFVKAHREALARYCVGISFVFHSPIFRFAISSFLLIQPLPMPYEVCKSREAALAWSTRRLLAVGAAPAAVVR